MLDLDEALDSELVRAREMVVELDQPGASAPVKLLGLPIKLDRTPGDPARAPGPALGEHTDEVLAALGYDAEEIAALKASGAVAGPAGRRAAGVVPWRLSRARPSAGPPGAARAARADGMLKMSELAERSGVSAGTIKHYLREGAARRRRRDPPHEPQHGLVPARLRRADPARSSGCRRSASCRCA